jgi:hypothetical protein
MRQKTFQTTKKIIAEALRKGKKINLLIEQKSFYFKQILRVTLC